MALRLVQIAMNASDEAAVGRFWAEALGWGTASEEPGVINLEPAGYAYPDPVAVVIDVIRVPEPKTVKNPVLAREENSGTQFRHIPGEPSCGVRRN